MSLPFGGPASEMRPRASTLPTDVLRRMRQGRHMSKETSPSNSGRTTPQRNGSHKGTQCSGNHSPNGSVHLRVDNKSGGSPGSMSPKLRRAHSDKHHRKGVPKIIEPEVDALTTDKYINMCIHYASDESLAVHRDPLPRGSMAYERVMRDFEPDIIDATKKTLLSVDNIKSLRNTKQKDKEQCSSAPSSPQIHRHVHFRK